jgi:hypothetical protein
MTIIHLRKYDFCDSINILQKCYTILLYVHNFILTLHTLYYAQDTKDAEYMLRKLVDEYMKWGLQIHFGKTEMFDTGPGGRYRD